MQKEGKDRITIRISDKVMRKHSINYLPKMLIMHASQCINF